MGSNMRAAAALPSFFIISFFTYKSYYFDIHDFANYYYGAYGIIKGFYSSKIYDALYFNQTLSEFGLEGLFVNFYPNTPFISWFFLPFAVVDWPLAKVSFNAIASIFFLWSLWRLKEHYELSNWLIVLIPVFFFMPIRNNLLFGQTYLLLFALLGEGLMRYDNGEKWIASLLWAIAIMLKVFPVVLFLWLLVKKDIRSFVFLACSCAFLIFVSIPFVGFESWQHFIFEVLPRSSSGDIYDGFTIKAKSVLIFLKNLFVYDEMLNPHPYIASEFLYTVISAIFKSTIVLIGIAATWQYRHKSYVSFAIWIFISLMIGPTNSSYGKVLLIFIMMVIFKEFKSDQMMIISAVLLVVIANLPTNWFYELPLLFSLPVIYVQIALLIIIVFAFKLRFNSKIFASFFLIFSCMGLNQLSESPYEYVIADQRHPLILSSIGEKDGLLIYSFWDQGGEFLQSTTYPISKMTKEEVEIRNNNIYYKGKRMTNSSDNKMEAYLVNEKEVLFLSDYKRGEGCYALRKISIPY